MSSASVQLTPELRGYLLKVGIDEPEPLRKLREETASLPDARMQISPEQGAFMAWLARTLGVRTAIEVGVYTGYSGLCVSLAMGPAGRLTALDVSEEFTRIAVRHWQVAGVSRQIDLRIGPATDSLDRLLRDGLAGSYDQAFIDADKENYLAYFERCLKLIRPGGVILFDNVLWSGRVINPSQKDADTLAIRELNQRLNDDDRIERVMLPLGDGLTLCRKK